MYRISLALLTLLFYCKGFCSSTWIHAVGIDESNVNQNYDTFYQSAVSFNNECSQSKAKPTCLLYVNDNPTLHRSDSSFSDTIKNNLGIPNTEKIKKIISDKVASAKDGDTVIISLQNHGAPVEGKSPACIWLSANDKICENDISEILKNKPKGVKILINADACFSGAFADLSSSEVCTATQANRLEFGYTNRRSFWNAISERYPQTLKDLAEPIIKESGQQRLLSSQVILQQLCQGARKKASLESVISALSIDDSKAPAYEPSACRDNDMTARKLNKFGNQVLATLQKEKSCKDLDLPKAVCDARMRLKEKKSEVATLIQSLEPMAIREVDLMAWMRENAALIPGMTHALGSQMKNLSPDEAREIADSIKLGKTPDWTKFNQQKISEIRKGWDLAQPVLSKFSEISRNSKNIDETVLKLKKIGAYDDLITLQGCFYENSPQINNNLTDYQVVGKKFPERKFSEQNYEEALKCEASIQF